MGCDAIPCQSPLLEVVSPVGGSTLGAMRQATGEDYDQEVAWAILVGTEGTAGQGCTTIRGGLER